MAWDSGFFLRLSQKDESAFNEVYFAYLNRMYLYAYGIIPNHQVAEEIADDTLFEIYESGEIKDEKHLENFAYKVAYHRCIDYLRSETRKKKFFGGIYFKKRIREERLEAALNNALLLGTVFKVMQETLSPEVQKVMIAAFIYGYIPAEIAEQEGKSVNTIRTQIKNGRDVLRKYIPNIDNLLMLPE